jgi:chemotaxis protein MotB
MRGRRNSGNGLDAWPGYVDALSTLLMVTIFVLLVFVLAEAFLSVALTGSDNTISQLKSQIAQLTESLSMQTAKTASLTQELAEPANRGDADAVGDAGASAGRGAGGG